MKLIFSLCFQDARKKLYNKSASANPLLMNKGKSLRSLQALSDKADLLQITQDTRSSTKQRHRTKCECEKGEPFTSGLGLSLDCAGRDMMCKEELLRGCRAEPRSHRPCSHRINQPWWRIKRIKMGYVPAPMPYVECDHYVLQICLAKNFQIK